VRSGPQGLPDHLEKIQRAAERYIVATNGAALTNPQSRIRFIENVQKARSLLGEVESQLNAIDWDKILPE
jgi:hypothetical protein